MAKKKKEEDSSEKIGKDEIDGVLNKKFGGVFLSADYLKSQRKTVIEISPTIDMMLGGGIPSGSFVVISGKPGLGKSTLCLSFAAEAQKNGFKVYYLNVEGRLKTRDVNGIYGLDLSQDKFEIIGSVKGKILSGEEYLDILLSLVETKENCVFIVDSVSQLCSSGRHAANIADRFRDDIPLMLASLTKRVSNILPVNNNILMCITHIIANQGGMPGSATTMEASGQKIQYQADVKMKATWAEAHEVKEKQVGQLVHWECSKSAIGPPGGKCTSLLRYGIGIDKYYDLLSMCVDIGLIKKSGSWFQFPDESKFQGLENAAEALKANPDVYNQIHKSFKELIS